MSASDGSEQPKAIQDVRSLLYRKLRVTLVSDRVLEGDFTCLDKQGNIILSNTFEQLPSSAAGKKEERHMGLVLVPVQQQRRVELQASVDERLGLLKLVEAAAPAAQAAA